MRYLNNLGLNINLFDNYDATTVSRSLNGYIIGMALGSALIIFAVSYFIFILIKGRVYRKLLKRVGVIAQQTINDDIKLWSKHTNNKFYKTPLFRHGNNKIFKLDSLLLTDKALLVIEIKSIKGGIRGSSNDKEWTKVTEEKSLAIPNIVVQNDGKIAQLRNILGVKVPMISLIIFSNKATFIDLTDLPSHVIVTKHTDIFYTLDDINASLKSTIDKELKKVILKKLKNHITNKSKDHIVFEHSVGLKELLTN